MRQLLMSGASAHGTVVGTEKKTDDQETYYHPRVQFTTVDGRTVVFTSALGSLVEPDIGDPVPVRYHPARPDQAEADSGISWILPAATTAGSSPNPATRPTRWPAQPRCGSPAEDWRRGCRWIGACQRPSRHARRHPATAERATAVAAQGTPEGSWEAAADVPATVDAATAHPGSDTTTALNPAPETL
jgi:hypothetical protein